MFYPTESSTVDPWLQPMKLAVFLLPFLASQLLTGLWLLLIGARRPDADDRASRIAREVFDGIGHGGRRYRKIRIVIAAVAQPHIVSILSKPILVLPRQGLAYFEERGGANPEQSFRAAIGHEAGHLESWDDLLFLPSFSYLAASALLCMFGFYQAIAGRIALPAVLSQSLAVCALIVLATYVLRRREAYSDSFSVVALRSVEATKAMLESLRGERSSKRSWLTTRFDVQTRLALLAQRGRSFLEMTRYDLAITAFIYLNLGKPSVGDVAAGAGVVWLLSLWLDALTHFALTWMLVLMIAGAVIARQGERLPSRELFGAALLSVVAGKVHELMRVGVFGVDQIAMMIKITMVAVVISGVGFLLVMTGLNWWTVAVVSHREGDGRERLVWGAFWITTLFLLPKLLFEVVAAGFARSFANTPALEALGGGSTEQQMRAMAPLGIMVVTLWLCWIGLAIGVAVWSRRRARSVPGIICSFCSLSIFPGSTAHPIALVCPRCGGVLRPDLLVEIEPAGAAA
jgi:hypothetical protein